MAEKIKIDYDKWQECINTMSNLCDSSSLDQEISKLDTLLSTSKGEFVGKLMEVNMLIGIMQNYKKKLFIHTKELLSNSYTEIFLVEKKVADSMHK